MKKLVYVFFVLSMVSIVGCARCREGVKCVLGVSTKVLEDNRSGAVVKEFPLDFKTSYAKTQEALVRIGAYVYHKNAGMFALYVSETDTTPVGIFLTSVNANQTKLEFSSPSTFAKEYIARRISLRLEGKKDELFPEEPAKEIKESQPVVAGQQPQTKRLQDQLQN